MCFKYFTTKGYMYGAWFDHFFLDRPRAGRSVNFNCMYQQTIYFSRPQCVMNVSGLGTKIAGEG